MALYTSPSIILSDSGVAQEPVRRYRAGTLTYEEALNRLRAGYREWQHDEGCKRYFSEWAATLKAIHALRTGDWGDTATDLIELIAAAGECTRDAADELGRRADTFFADDQYDEAIKRSPRRVGGNRANGRSHWVMWQDTGGAWSHVGFFGKATDEYNYWHRDAYLTLAVEDNRKGV